MKVQEDVRIISYKNCAKQLVSDLNARDVSISDWILLMTTACGLPTVLKHLPAAIAASIDK